MEIPWFHDLCSIYIYIVGQIQSKHWHQDKCQCHHHLTTTAGYGLFAPHSHSDDEAEMKFNKAEIAVLARQQPSNNFDQEGVLFVRERSEGLFGKHKNEGKYNGNCFFVCRVLYIYGCILINKGKQTVGTSLICVGGTGKGKYIFF